MRLKNFRDIKKCYASANSARTCPGQCEARIEHPNICQSTL